MLQFVFNYLLNCSLLNSFFLARCFLSLQVDLNHDRLVSLEEFLKSTEKKEFNNPNEWEVRVRFRCMSHYIILSLHASVLCQLIIFLHFKTLDDTKPVYTEEELQRFEAELQDREMELGRRAEKLRQEQELLKERSKALEAQKREYQQVKDCFQLVATLFLCCLFIIRIAV